MNSEVVSVIPGITRLHRIGCSCSIWVFVFVLLAIAVAIYKPDLVTPHGVSNIDQAMIIGGVIYTASGIIAAAAYFFFARAIWKWLLEVK